MMGTELPSSSFASSSNTQWTYDVFLSFRGEDTRKSFADHLYAALDQEGIFVFRDDEELHRGQPISSNLLEAIQVSRIALVVISRNYASSKWCLDELTTIVECMEDRGQVVFPIFYDVDPREVRKQTGWFRQVFIEHERRSKDDLEKHKVQKWRAALTRVANLSGFHLQDRYESKFIREIMGKIVNELRGTVQQPHSDDLGLVGIDFAVEEIMKYSATDQGNDVVFIGIWGMGGVGKTTLAQAFYDKISDQFQDKCFLRNVREISRRDGIVALTKDLLRNVLKKMDVHDSEVRHRFRRKKVLIILDDVDKLEQLQALAGSNNWFGRGSRIIITTRDSQLLIAHHVDRCYKVKELKSDDALKLFSWKAFKNDHPPKDYMELSHSFVNYSKGLPLAIEVLGSFLCGHSLHEWGSAFSRIQEHLDKDIMSALRISFDGLHEKEQQIFLDIACFFKGQERDEVTILLEGFGFDPIIGISNLIRKSLISMVGSKLWMHDLLQEMGWELVRGESLNEPGNRSRLWQPDDVLDLLKYHKGSDAVQGIVLTLPQEQKEQLKCDALSNMKKLRFLKMSNVLLPLGLNYLSTELRVLEWHGYPSKLLPTDFPSEKLVQLNLFGSHIKHLWKGFKCLDMLKSIDLMDSENLIETPDFTGVPNLERLNLEGCTKLSKVHPSISNLIHLRLLNMKNCERLQITSWDISLKSLEIFNLSGCARLKRFPEIVGDMKCLSKIYLDGSAIEELPVSIEHLTGLTLLDMAHCKNILRIPSVISSLPRLKTIILSGCSNLIEIPENIGNVECLEELDISGTAIRQMPSSIVYLRNLKKLSCSWCSGQVSTSLLFPCLPEVCPGPNFLLPASLSGFSSLMSLNLSYCNLIDGALPNDLDRMSSLMELKLRGNNFTSIPESICRLSKLIKLELDGCIRLQSLPKLPSSIKLVGAAGCMSLKSDSDQYDVFYSSEKTVWINKLTTSTICSINIRNSQFAAWLNIYHEVNEVQVDISLPVRTAYGLSIGTHGIPNWFNNWSRNFSITIPLRKGLIYNSRLWRGCAFYVGLEVDENFDTSSDFKVMHKFDCCFDTMEGPGYKQTLYHEQG
ncbi:disease resistance protein RUN1-like isoform X2 [Rosa rugosa]|uniref:disease resistance protein RUN1-like isoform X2 n=1 Tax=Rosa rugosa TaxID=74645 RepID=UPI002B401FA0|nr:disease resistance protein RUN1-like isoform X2 [Rosa rugosa]